MHTYVCMYVGMYACMYVLCMYICMYVYMCTNVCGGLINATEALNCMYLLLVCFIYFYTNTSCSYITHYINIILVYAHNI